jgi:hypothetical protein
VIDSNPHARRRPDLHRQNLDPLYDCAGGMMCNDPLRPGSSEITWVANGYSHCHFRRGSAMP